MTAIPNVATLRTLGVEGCGCLSAIPNIAALRRLEVWNCPNRLSS
jgi:hypothetical protein